MKPPTTAIASRPAVAALSLYSRPLAARRCYATHSNATTKPAGRRAVTPVHDDGHIPWSELSVKEKTGRVAEQTVNFGIIVLGVVLTGGVGYYLYQEVFSPDSKVAYYNRAVDRIRKDPRCLELLGQGNEIKAFGQETNSAWRRARPIASTLSSDGSGTEHLRIQFNVQGPKGTGISLST
ncbi:hypothetical protein P8C59_004773 [Phyllachora maydis]|uniref:Mitochondrial import inner membrane translocase subunit Tim21 n=1 Tax=Phyllachora maydis TaxID=1825666 RepID=A0AAD9MBM1_9PEZI|nr:hypothetical protein P8C59_004773 [Phyllachora maydis]